MKQYEELWIELLSFPTEDIICTSISQDDDKDNQTPMPDLPFIG